MYIWSFYIRLYYERHTADLGAANDLVFLYVVIFFLGD